MGDSSYRNDIYNSVKIFITDLCKNGIDKDDVGEGDKYSKEGVRKLVSQEIEYRTMSSLLFLVEI